MEFRLTYDGPLLSYSSQEDKQRERSHHIHDIRQRFHRQLKRLWAVHPILHKNTGKFVGLMPGGEPRFHREGFTFLPIATEEQDLYCRLDILMLRNGTPGGVRGDIDNRMKTLFDALRMPTGPDELGQRTSKGIRTPQADEDPFYVLLEDDDLITHLSVTNDTLLEPVEGCPFDQAARLVINVSIRPYNVHLDNVSFT